MKHAKSFLPIVVLFSVMYASVFAEPFKGRSGPEGHRGPPPFSSLDMDGNGLVTLTEFEQHDIPHGDHTTVFNDIDADGDGAISETELTSHKPPRRRQ